MDITKQYFTQINAAFTPVPQRAAITMEMIRKYRLGTWIRCVDAIGELCYSRSY